MSRRASAVGRLAVAARALAVVCTALATAPAQARTLLTSNGIEVRVEDGETWCGDSVGLTFVAEDASPFRGDRVAVQELLGGVRAVLGFECPQVQEIQISGEVDGNVVYEARASAAEGWVLVTLPQEPPAAGRPVVTRVLPDEPTAPEQEEPAPPEPTVPPVADAGEPTVPPVADAGEPAAPPTDADALPPQGVPESDDVAEEPGGTAAPPSGELEQMLDRHFQLEEERQTRLKVLVGQLSPSSARAQPYPWQSGRVFFGPQQQILGLWRLEGDIHRVSAGDSVYRRLPAKEKMGVESGTGILHTIEFFPDGFFLLCRRCYYQNPTEPIRFEVNPYLMDDESLLEGLLIDWSYELDGDRLRMWLGPSSDPKQERIYQRPVREECRWYEEYKKQLFLAIPSAPDHPAYRRMTIGPNPKKYEAMKRNAFKRLMKLDSNCGQFVDAAPEFREEPPAPDATEPARPSPPPRSLPELAEAYCGPVPAAVRRTLGWHTLEDLKRELTRKVIELFLFVNGHRFRSLVRMATLSRPAQRLSEYADSAAEMLDQADRSRETADYAATTRFLESCRQTAVDQLRGTDLVAPVSPDQFSEIGVLCQGIQDELWRVRCPFGSLDCVDWPDEERGCADAL